MFKPPKQLKTTPNIQTVPSSNQSKWNTSKTLLGADAKQKFRSDPYIMPNQ